MHKFRTMLIITLTNLLICSSLWAQSPEKISYQAVIRDATNNLVTSHAIGMRVSILQSSVTGIEVYKEIYNPNPQTNANGLVTIEIGSGIPLTGVFANINWTSGPYFIKTETDPSGGTNYTITGTSQLLSVPYALHSKTAESLSGGISETDPIFGASAANGITSTNITNWTSAYSWGDHTGLYRPISYVPAWIEITGKPTLFDGTWSSLTGKPTTLAGYGITDGMNSSHVSNGITSTDIANWTSAYNWGNHSTQGYLKTYTETDPIFGAWNKSTGISITASQVSDFASSVTNNPAVLANTAKNSYPTADEAKVANLSGTNTGDETTTTIKTKLGIVTLSGSNTGDQDLSNLVVKGESNSINSSMITDGSVSSADILDGTISSADVNSAAIQLRISGSAPAGQYITEITSNGTIVTAYDNNTVYTGGDGIKLTGTNFTLDGAVSVLNGGTGQSTYTNGQLLIGNTTGNTLIKSTLTKGDGINITNGNGSITIASDIGTSSTQVAAGNHTHSLATTLADGFMSAADKIKSDGIAIGAEVNVNADWNATSGDAQILNKPTILAGTTPGQMQYWNGTAWVTINPPTLSGKVLYFIDNVPQWGPVLSSTDVMNGATGKIWMDRNLGASQVATSSTDAAAYGDLYQWGRGADGHQIRTSGTTTTLSTTDNPGHGNFITNGSSPYDWRSPQNDNLWQGVDGTNNPCPSGYRLPTGAELEAERLSWNSNNSAGAFASPLKLPVAGYRYYSNGTLNDVGSNGGYWSGTVNGAYARSLYFNSSIANMNSSYLAYGFSVRCLKD